jgi:hypothetical protein
MLLSHPASQSISHVSVCRLYTTPNSSAHGIHFLISPITHPHTRPAQPKLLERRRIWKPRCSSRPCCEGGWRRCGRATQRWAACCARPRRHLQHRRVGRPGRSTPPSPRRRRRQMPAAAAAVAVVAVPSRQGTCHSCGWRLLRCSMPRCAVVLCTHLPTSRVVRGSVLRIACLAGQLHVRCGNLPSLAPVALGSCWGGRCPSLPAAAERAAIHRHTCVQLVC